MLKKIRIVQYGCGYVGCAIVRLASMKPNIEVAGAIDLTNIGVDLGEAAELGHKLGIPISNEAVATLIKVKPDIVLHATGSVLEEVYPQLETVIKAGFNLISTCEELSYPFWRQPALASKIDELAKKHGVTVLSTGINPGFLMDTWPLAMTGVCQEVNHIRAVRIQDASPRRLSFQLKIGAGKTIEEFSKLVEARTLRHVGLEESIAMIAAGLGWEMDEVTETIEPIVAATEVRSNFLTVRSGQVAGVKQIGRGSRKGKELIILDFQAYIGAKESYDAVYITGIPNVEVIIKGGIHGDIATAAMVVNSIPKVLGALSGLITMGGLPVVCALPNTQQDKTL